MKVDQLFNVADQILDHLGTLIRNSRAPTGGPDRLRVSLYLTISEQFEAALLLAKAQMITHSASHVRSMVEALVAMKMLELDNGYIDQMQYERFRGERNVYKGIFDDPNIPAQIKEALNQKREACEFEFNTLHSAGRRPKRISDGFGAAKLYSLVGPYSMLCAFSHNDLAVLAHRHQGEVGMVYKQKNSPELVMSIIFTAIQVVMDGTEQFGRLAKFTGIQFYPIFEIMNKGWCVLLDASIEE